MQYRSDIIEILALVSFSVVEWLQVRFTFESRSRSWDFKCFSRSRAVQFPNRL